MKRTGVATAVVVGVLVAGCTAPAAPGPEPTPPSPTETTTPPEPEPAPTEEPEPEPPGSIVEIPRVRVAEVTDVVTGLAAPWGLAFLPDGSALVTERDSAQVLHLVDGEATVLGGPGAEQLRGEVTTRSEGGLLGVAVSPEFAQDDTVFLYYTAAEDNRVVRFSLTDGELSDGEPILAGIPKGDNHNGGRLAFGPDGYLYVTTGEIYETQLAQDRDSLGGKILRITPQGDPAPDNPFGTAVWSWGHRNVQGIGWAPDGRAFASEFGQNTWDELNLIEPGSNYGWPVVEGEGGGGGEFTDPLHVWATSQASPSGLAVTEEGVYLASLRGARLWRVPLTADGTGEPQELLTDYGRLRAVEVAPDGSLWVVTNNTDGRGRPQQGDDRILRVAVEPAG